MKKKSLYRKVNTKARGVHHHFGGDFKIQRNTKDYDSVGMKRDVERGLDYTPLFKFLLTKVGEQWDKVNSEAVSRLDKQEPIYWLVSTSFEDANETVLIGENSYYSGLYVDSAGVLRVVNPQLDESSIRPTCKCCTHTFNGIPFTQKFLS